MQPDLAAMTDLASLAARKAGGALREHSAEWQQITDGKHRDLKLNADRQSEQIILDTLRSGPDIPVLTEEAGAIGKPDADGYRWIVDPLDGTVNYRYGLPFACVSIALCQGDEPRCGVVYDFWRDELFSASVGSGGSVDGKPLHVSTTSKRQEAIIATGFPANRDFGEESLRRTIAILQQYRKVRLLGSAAISLAYVASGRVDAYHEEDIMLWDVAAGVALVIAAGGHASVALSSRIPNACTVYAAARPELLGVVKP